MAERAVEPPSITHLYRGPDDWTTVRLVCPWASGTNMVPPPRIQIGGTVFRFVGSEDG